MVFDEVTMKERLSATTYKAWKKCVTDGAHLELSAANGIAEAIRSADSAAAVYLRNDFILFSSFIIFYE